MALSWQLMTTGVFGNGGRSTGQEGGIWQTDACTLRDVVTDRSAMKARLGVYPSVERVWALSLLGCSEQAVAEGHLLLAGSKERFRPLLVLAHAYWYQCHWRDAALLQEEALQLARFPAREALVRYEIGRRFFDERRYRDAAAEFDWASDLYRTAGHKRLARVCRQALDRARRVHVSYGEFRPEGPACLEPFPGSRKDLGLAATWDGKGPTPPRSTRTEEHDDP